MNTQKTDLTCNTQFKPCLRTTSIKSDFSRTVFFLFLALYVLVPRCIGDAIISASIGADLLFQLKINFPPVKRVATTTPGYQWEAKLRLLTFPPIWGTSISNLELRDMDWTVAQKDAYEGRPEAAYLMAHKLIKDQNLYGRAAYLLDAAASKGHAGAQNDMGVLYLFGLGVPRDIQEALDFFRKSAARGESMAELNLGFCYLSGIGVQQSESRAASYIEAAARKGNPVAKSILAASYAVGTGLTTQDLDKAYKLVLEARVYGSDWPLETKTSKSGAYYVSLDKLENFIGSQIDETQRARLQRELSGRLKPLPPPSQTLSDRMERQRRDRPDVVVFGPTPQLPETNAVPVIP